MCRVQRVLNSGLHGPSSQPRKLKEASRLPARGLRMGGRPGDLSPDTAAPLVSSLTSPTMPLPLAGIVPMEASLGDKWHFPGCRAQGRALSPAPWSVLSQRDRLASEPPRAWSIRLPGPSPPHVHVQNLQYAGPAPATASVPESRTHP